MDAEKMMMQKRIDNLCEQVEILKHKLEEEKANHQHTIECARQFEEDWVQMKRERDALIYDLKEASPCFACKAFLRNSGKCHGGHGCLDDLMIKIFGDKVGSGWEWRGLCAENGGAEDADL